MYSIWDFARDCLLFLVICGLTLDLIGEARIRAFAKILLGLAEGDKQYQEEFRIYNEKLLEWIAHKKSLQQTWEAKCAQEQPKKWARKIHLDSAIEKLNSTCKSLMGGEYPPDFSSGPFRDLDMAEKELDELMSDFGDPQDPPPKPVPPASSSMESFRSRAYGIALIILIAVSIILLVRLRMETSDFLPVSEPSLLERLMQLALYMFGFFIPALTFTALALVSRVFSIFAGYVVTLAANVLGHIISRPKLHLTLRVAAIIDVAWTIWTRPYFH